jgi:hypothetical protein
MTRVEVFELPQKLGIPQQVEFKSAAAVLLVAVVADVVASAVLLGRLVVFLRLDMLLALAEAVAVYLFLLPMVMRLIQRDIQRGRADATDFALLLILLHVATTTMFRMAIAVS